MLLVIYIINEAWDRNFGFELSFDDNSSQEIQSDDTSKIKAGLTGKINSSTRTLVFIGKYIYLHFLS